MQRCSFLNQILLFYLKKDNPKTIFTVCSYREFIFNQCPQYVYNQLNQSIFYADLYFVRSVFKFNLLSPQQQYFIKTNDFISFYGRAAFKASQNEGIIQISNIYNSDQTSVQQVNPSLFYNYTASDFENCFGNDFIEPYDPRCRYWYKYAQKNKGFFIFEPYIDALTGTLLMSLSTQMEYESQFYSVDNIDFSIPNILQVFDSDKSENSYSVLFHEFNSTVFFHPLLVFYQVMTWADIEFFNINQFCSISIEQMHMCQSQKQEFAQQVNETIEFIKSGSYSIENTNFDKFYQQWQRFGQKQISFILPVQSQLKGYNNQQPYSFAIIFIARVITDRSDQLKLFNLINIQFIKYFLVFDFVLGENPNQTNMQIDQSQNQFLLEEESTRQFQNTPIKFCQVVEKSFDEQSKTNHDFIDSPLKKLNSHFNSPLQSSKNSYSPPQNLKKLNQSTQRIFDYIQQSHILGKKCDNIQLNSQDQNFSFNRANYSPNSQNKFKERLQKKVAFKEQEQIREERKEKILKGLKPLFLEMKIIKQVFQDLESVINYQINSQNQNQQNSMKTLFHFTQAKTIFQKLKNQTGLSRCYYNLGIIYLLKYDFSLGSEYFESAIQLNLESLGINYQDLTNQKFIDTSSIKTENQILILSKRLFSQAYCLKQQALQ
ncbi:tetratricopeptide repeat protein, partial (macronuclear) [Tetrahymena thermophila SB210]